MFAIKMAAFCGRIQQQQRDRLVAQKFNPEIHNHAVTTKTGRKFVSVNIGSRSAFMVERETGNIFGVKGVGQPHYGHFYGTLETVDQYFWGDYYPVKLDGSVGLQKANGCPSLTFAPKVETI